MPFTRLIALVWLLPVLAQAAGVTVYTNGTIYTVNEAAPLAQALTVSADGILLAVGTEQKALQAAKNAGEYTVVDLHGRLVLPGFQDAHVHAVEAGIYEKICPIEPETIPSDLASVLESCGDDAFFGGAGWIVGVGVEYVALRFCLFIFGLLVCFSSSLSTHSPLTCWRMFV